MGLLDLIKRDNALTETPIGSIGNPSSKLNSLALDRILKIPAMVKALDVRQTAISQIPLIEDMEGREGNQSSISLSVEKLNILSKLNDVLASVERDLAIYANAIITMELDFIPWSDVKVRKSSTTEYGLNSLSAVNNPVYEYKNRPLNTPLHFKLPSGKGKLVAPYPIDALQRDADIHFHSASNISTAYEKTSNPNNYIIGVQNLAGQVINKQDLDNIGKKISDGEAPIVQGKVNVATLLGNTNISDAKQYAELKTNIAKQVALITDVPAPLLEDLSQSTYNNLSTMFNQWWRRSIPSRLDFYTKNINFYIKNTLAISDFEVKFDLEKSSEFNSIVEEKQDRVLKLLELEVIKVEEARQLLDITSLLERGL